MDRTMLSSLRAGSYLKGSAYTYHIERVLGQGSFGITYLATTAISVPGPLGNIETEIRVAVKEFFMKEFSSRHEDGAVTEMTDGSLVQNYAKKFRKEAENLAKLSHPNIVNVLEVFDANNTCYYAMQYMEGGSLDEYVRSRGGLPEDEAKECIRQIGEAVSYMHEHRMLHLDLKPSNVMRSGNGSRMVLIDFGLSKQYEENGIPESSTTIGLGTPGYAPLEQSRNDREKDFAPTLDVYALGATYYKLLTGKTPPDAIDVSTATMKGTDMVKSDLVSAGVSTTAASACSKAMHPLHERRCQTVADFLKLTEADGSVDEDTDLNEFNKPHPPKSEPPVPPTPLTPPKPRKVPGWIVAALCAILAVIVGSIVTVKVIKGRGQGPQLIADTTVMALSGTVPLEGPSSQQSNAVTVPTEDNQSAPSVVQIESISLNETTLELEVGDTYSLKVKYDPSNATDRTTTWKSSDPKAAKVSPNGKVTAVKAGSAAIIASCGGKDAYCNVTVKAKPAPEPVKPQPTVPASKPTTGSISGHEYVDLGLPSGLLWATCNVGASNPSDYGSYFAWGETSTKSRYDYNNVKYYLGENSSNNSMFSKYCTDSKYGTIDNKTRLDLSDDAARANWGGSWRMPTKDEWVELKNNCTWTWTSYGGHNGYKVSGKNENSIFLPAAGWRIGGGLNAAGERGYYWSSSLCSDESYGAYYCWFNSSGVNPSNWNFRFYGHSIRPVSSSL